VAETLAQFSIPVAFRAFVLSLNPTGELERDSARNQIQNTIADRIHYQHVPEFTPEECEQGILPYVWFRQSGSLRERCLDSYDPKPHVITLDVEVWSVDPQTSEIIENDFAVLMESFTGDLSSIKVADVLIENQDDDYVPQGIAADYGLHAQAFQIEFYPDWN
jgi:hypothetical protein